MKPQMMLFLAVAVLGILACDVSGAWRAAWGSATATPKPIATVKATERPTPVRPADSPTPKQITPAPPPTDTPTPTPVPGAMLIARNNHRCLTVLGNRVIQSNCSGARNQLWSFVPEGTYFQIVTQSDKCLTIEGGSEIAVAHFTASDCRRQADQLWRLREFGDWVQIISQERGQCVDMRQFGGDEVILWACKSGNADNNINDNDNQLWLRSTSPAPGSDTRPPPGVYVTGFEMDPPVVRQDIWFHVTFQNTTGAGQPYRWWVKIKRLEPGLGSGETAKKDEVFSVGSVRSDSRNAWRIGPVCSNFSAQVYWWRAEPEPHEVPFRDLLGRQPVITFRIC